MSRERKRDRLIYFAVMAGVFVLMLLLNMHTPLMMDDYDYSFSWSTGERLSGLGDIIASQAAHYRLWGGRSVTHFLAQLFLYWGKPVFNIANAAMYCLLLLEICMLSGRRERRFDWRLPLAAHGLIFFLTPFFGVTFLWLDGACNYLWGTALALVPLAIAVSEREGGLFDTDAKRAFAAVPLGFLAGWTNENTACGVLAALILLMIWDRYRGRRIRIWRAAMLAAQALGVIVMLAAPGNFSRAGGETERGLVMEMIYRFAVTSYCLVRYAGVILVLGLAALLLARRKKAALRFERLGILLACALLSAYALVGSPQISDRSFTAVIVLSVCALLLVLCDSAPQTGRQRLGLACAALLCVLGGAAALGDVRAHESAWQAQLAAIEAAAESSGEARLESVPSASRYTMGIVLAESPDSWPNSTLGKYYGVRIWGR